MTQLDISLCIPGTGSKLSKTPITWSRAKRSATLVLCLLLIKQPSESKHTESSWGWLARALDCLGVRPHTRHTVLWRAKIPSPQETAMRPAWRSPPDIAAGEWAGMVSFALLGQSGKNMAKWNEKRRGASNENIATCSWYIRQQNLQHSNLEHVPVIKKAEINGLGENLCATMMPTLRYHVNQLLYMQKYLLHSWHVYIYI